MYRLSIDIVSVENDNMVRTFVSGALLDWMECIFGEVNDEGLFTDTDRVKKFICKVEGGEISKKQLKKGKGLLSKDISVLDLITARYSDIYAKIKDEHHEYTFDEFGELLISKLILFYEKGDFAYLTFYENNKIRFEDCLEFIGKHSDIFLDDDCSVEQIREAVFKSKDWFAHFIPFYYRYDSKLREKIAIALNECGKIVCEDLLIQNDDLYDEETGCFKVDAPSLEDCGKAYEEMWCEVLSDISLYGMDKCPQTIEYYDAELTSALNSKEIADLLETCYGSILFWDYDYLEFEEKLKNPNELDSYLKMINKFAGYCLTCWDDIFKDKDIVEDI